MRREFNVKRYHQLKSFIYSLDHGKCHICHKTVAYKKAALDHVVPVSLFATPDNNDYWNLRLAHKSCNSKRGAGRIPGQLRLYIAADIDLQVNYKEFETRQGTKTEFQLLRLTPAEKQLLSQEAQKLGISISAFVRLLFRNWASKVTFEKS